MNKQNITEKTKTQPDANLIVPKPLTPLREFWFYFSKNKEAVVGLVFIAIVVLQLFLLILSLPILLLNNSERLC